MSEEMVVKKIAIDDIYIDDDFNCRGPMTPIDVEELANDIKANGLHQPVVIVKLSEEKQREVGKTYRLVAGFRRTYAHKINKATVIDAVIKENMTDIQARVLNLSENLKRKQLNILQEAKALEALYLHGVPRQTVADVIGMSLGWVQTRFSLLMLPEKIQKEAASGVLNQYQIKKMIKLTPEKQFEVLRKIKDAKAKGESTDHIITRKKPEPQVCKVRTRVEIKALLDFTLDTLGECLATYALAWAAGNINDIELYSKFKKYAEENNIDFVSPI